MPQSLASITVGAETYPYKVEPRCRACSDPERLPMEEALVKGWTYERIVNEYGSGDVNARGLRNHVLRGHLPVNAVRVQRARAEHSQEVTEAIKPLVAASAANVSFAHAVVERVQARLANGEIEPTIRDGIAAARLISESSPGSTDADIEQWRDQLMFVYEAVKEVMTPAQFDDLAARLNKRAREIEARSR